MILRSELNSTDIQGTPIIQSSLLVILNLLTESSCPDSLPNSIFRNEMSVHEADYIRSGTGQTRKTRYKGFP